MTLDFEKIEKIYADNVKRSPQGAERMLQADRIEQLGHLIFLKILDEEEAVHEDRLGSGQADINTSLLFPAQSARYRWRNWALKSGADLLAFLRDEVFPYMASLSKEDALVAEYFRDASFEFESPGAIKGCVEALDPLRLSEMSQNLQGAFFDGLVTSLGAHSLNGLFATPRHIRHLMVELLDPDLGELVFDPACGTGGFLVDVVNHIVAKYSDHTEEQLVGGEKWLKRSGKSLSELITRHRHLQTRLSGDGAEIQDWNRLGASIYGTDVSRQMVRISTANLLLRNIRRPNLKRANSLSDREGLTDADRERKYDVILCNPPFGGLVTRDSVRPELAANSKKSELLFLSLLMQHLAPGGRCAAIVPNSLLESSSTAHVELRARLVQEFDLLAVIGLPIALMKPVMSVKTVVLVFRRPLDPKTSRPDRTWFYDICFDGYHPEKVSKSGRLEAPLRNQIPQLLRTWRAYKESGFTQLPEVPAGSFPTRGNEAPPSWLVSHAEIRDAAFNLSPSNWQPPPSLKQSNDDPRVLLIEVIADYQELLIGLEKLKDEIES